MRSLTPIIWDWKSWALNPKPWIPLINITSNENSRNNSSVHYNPSNRPHRLSLQNALPYTNLQRLEAMSPKPYAQLSTSQAIKSLETGSAFPYNPSSKYPRLSLPQFSKTGSHELKTPKPNSHNQHIKQWEFWMQMAKFGFDTSGTNQRLSFQYALPYPNLQWLETTRPKPRFLFINLVIVEGTKYDKILETMTRFAIILPVDTHVGLYSMRSNP